jgi:hypothetical protein
MILRRIALLVLGALLFKGAHADLLGHRGDVDATFLLSAENRQLPAHGALLSGVRAAAADSGEWLATPLRIIDISVRSGGGAAQAGALRVALAEGADGLIIRSAGDFPWEGFEAVFRAMDLPIAVADDLLGSRAGNGSNRVVLIRDEVFQRTLADHFAGEAAQVKVVVMGEPNHPWTRLLVATAEAAERVVVVSSVGQVPPDGLAEVWWIDPPLAEAPHLRDGSREGSGARIFVVACHPAWIAGLREGRIDQLWQPSPFDWGYAAVVRLRAAQGDTRLGEIAPPAAPVSFSNTAEEIAALEALWAHWLR